MEEKITFRQYDIMTAAKEFATVNSATEAEERAFIVGAKWSDRNPDIPTIWQDSSCKPASRSSMILAIGINDKSYLGNYMRDKELECDDIVEGIYRGYDCLVSWDMVEKWAYVDMIKDYIK